MKVKFKPIDSSLAEKLLDFATRDKVGQSIVVNGTWYRLDHISVGKNSFWRSRSASVYYRTGRSVVRISDHWSANPSRPRSRKANCGEIGDKWARAEDQEDQGWKTCANWLMATD